jgi:endonuclease V-like protein UPF0215 family
MKNIKKEIRILGIDDAPFNKYKDKKCMIVGTVFRGGNYMDALLSKKVDVDGNDATKKIIAMTNKTSHKDQLSCIMIDGIAVAGFNVIDINEIAVKTKMPVIVVTRNKPNFKKISNALKKIRQENKIKIIKNAGKVHKIKIKKGNIYFQFSKNINQEQVKKIIRVSATNSLVPEPIRIAHIIASGIVDGKSRGRA